VILRYNESRAPACTITSSIHVVCCNCRSLHYMQSICTLLTSSAVRSHCMNYALTESFCKPLHAQPSPHLSHSAHLSLSSLPSQSLSIRLSRFRSILKKLTFFTNIFHLSHFTLTSGLILWILPMIRRLDLITVRVVD